jgi:hypothetical protein
MKPRGTLPHSPLTFCTFRPRRWAFFLNLHFVNQSTSQMKNYLQLIAVALAALLIGGLLPGGTWWLTPIASLALVTLAFFGRQSPVVLLAVLDGEWRGIGRLAWAHISVRLFRLTLLAAPVWLVQADLWHSCFTPVNQAETTAFIAESTIRKTPVAVRVWAEPASATTPQTQMRIYMKTARAYRTLFGQTQDDEALGAAEIHSWHWADADLLPEVVIKVRRVNSDDAPDRVRTFYVPLLRGDIKEQTAWLAAGWRIFQGGFPFLGLAVAIWNIRQFLVRLMRLMQPATPSKS